MPVYNVYLGDVNSGLSPEVKNETQSFLQSWFSRITPRGTTAIVSWVDSMPTSIRDTELLVYFVANQNSSVVRYMPGASGIQGVDGWTAWANGQTASEVYVNGNNDLAGVAFHEMMHNKLHLDDAALHSRTGLAAVSVSPRSVPNDANYTDMRRGLRHRHRQWTGGWAAVSTSVYDGL